MESENPRKVHQKTPQPSSSDTQKLFCHLRVFCSFQDSLILRPIRQLVIITVLYEAGCFFLIIKVIRVHCKKTTTTKKQVRKVQHRKDSHLSPLVLLYLPFPQSSEELANILVDEFSQVASVYYKQHSTHIEKQNVTHQPRSPLAVCQALSPRTPHP